MAALSGCEKSCRGIGQLSAPISRIVGPQLASVNTIRIRLGHESLGRTLAYLKGKDAECAQPICVNTGVHASHT